MRGVNKAIIVGTLGGDPDTRVLPSGSQVTNISIATNESWTDKNTGQKMERTEWHSVTFFGRLSEVADQYLTKGSSVYVEGSLKTDHWEDQSGVKKSKTKINGSFLQIINTPDNNQQTGGNFQTDERGYYSNGAYGGNPTGNVNNAGNVNQRQNHANTQQRPPARRQQQPQQQQPQRQQQRQVSQPQQQMPPQGQPGAFQDNSGQGFDFEDDIPF